MPPSRGHTMPTSKQLRLDPSLHRVGTSSVYLAITPFSLFVQRLAPDALGDPATSLAVNNPTENLGVSIQTFEVQCAEKRERETL